MFLAANRTNFLLVWCLKPESKTIRVENVLASEFKQCLKLSLRKLFKANGAIVAM